MSKILKRKYDVDDYDSGRGKQDEWEVTGVSRSGRVRKKSSKLMDFESPDDIDHRHRRRGGDSFNSPTSSSGSGRGRGRGSSASSSTQHTERANSTVGVQQREALPNDGGDDIYSSSDEFPPDVPADESSPSSSSSENDDGVSDEERLVDGHGPVTTGQDESSSRASDDTPSNAGAASRGGQSLYMLEKSSKKKLVVRDGRVIGRTKAQRKDKGKTRFTAYMLWAKEVRQEILRSNPETDFATISKRLGELWATVPNSEKYAWKRRAKRIALTKPVSDASAQNTAAQGQGGPNQQAEGGRWRGAGSRSKFINKAGSGSSTTGGASGNSARQESSSISGSVPSSVGTSNAARTGAGTSATSGTARHQQQQVSELKAGVSTGVSGGRGLVAEATVGPGLYKVVGTQPVDVAAHLKLLGESLGIIGERLKEHEGQIAVSGSLSVLLDSLLCALGPLICLTRQLPETNSCPPEMLSKLLDNIAYFMPGL